MNEWQDLDECLRDRVRPPVAVVLGSPHEVTDLVHALAVADMTCYQMDLYQAERLSQELALAGIKANVQTAADLWDLPGDYQTVLYPAPQGGERQLKIDLIEQAFHVLRPRGAFLVLAEKETDQFFPAALKKVFGRVQVPAAGQGRVFLCRREGERPRRRHEVTFHVRFGEGPSLRFLSRPGVFSFGRFDDGARALVETMTVEPGDQVLDLGCGCGTNGVCAGRLAGPTGSLTFVDSNLRAVRLAEHNARENGLSNFRTIASSGGGDLPERSFDVVLANPPYFAEGRIAQFFTEHARELLRPGGRFYLVTKQPDLVGPVVAEAFGLTEPVLRRGYTVLCARAPGSC